MANILFISGSLREGSFTSQLAANAEKALEGKATVTYLDWAQVPVLNQDLETPVLPAVQAVRDAVKAADAVWVFSPVYNFSIPGSVKNLLDWLSRAEDLSDPSGKSAIDSKVTTVSLVAAAGHDQAAAIYRDLLPFIRTNFVDDITAVKTNGSAWADGKLILEEEALAQLNKQAESFLAEINK
ncbi:NADPH-dependent FMN reductase [Streptococcus gallinaceus]|uniref:NAD(P)H-dependent FMN reductase n=1 Tax=Streptococcus gallinaceus TaxID=165758 RepID=A0ABV2JJB3_9STRE|nr:NADPH-dependent FMN reductase [Streptococcus gallinaceus]MCP1639038.1 NAD(P)H-dependent FMN reductase [Streptococcus gallinaceus]MCP1769718.1 NAD(P)H-dependent FMN reductase [Streptococcus gallinaceus]